MPVIFANFVDCDEGTHLMWLGSSSSASNSASWAASMILITTSAVWIRCCLELLFHVSCHHICDTSNLLLAHWYQAYGIPYLGLITSATLRNAGSRIECRKWKETKWTVPIYWTSFLASARRSLISIYQKYRMKPASQCTCLPYTISSLKWTTFRWKVILTML